MRTEDWSSTARVDPNNLNDLYEPRKPAGTAFKPNQRIQMLEELIEGERPDWSAKKKGQAVQKEYLNQMQTWTEEYQAATGHTPGPSRPSRFCHPTWTRMRMKQERSGTEAEQQRLLYPIYSGMLKRIKRMKVDEDDEDLDLP